MCASLMPRVAAALAQWVETMISNAKLDGQFGHADYDRLYFTEEEKNAKVHIDALGVFVMLRVPLMAKWVVASGKLGSPAFLGWKYRVDVSPMFRLKWLFTRRPTSTLVWSTTLSWLMGTFVLHVFEYQFTPSFLTWLVTSFDVLVGLDYGPLMPDTMVGRLAACYLTVVGVLSSAMITAMFAGSFEVRAEHDKTNSDVRISNAGPPNERQTHHRLSACERYA